MKPILDYKEVVSILSMFYSDDQIQLTYAHPYEFPYVISVITPKLHMCDLRLLVDLYNLYNIRNRDEMVPNGVLLCFYQD